ncbi:MAG: cadherin repeat domain-containing protein [Candidatus Absconditicoccaceae bacterium]
MKRNLIYFLYFIFISLGFIFLPNFSFAIQSETKVWQTTNSAGDPDIADSNPSKNVYIDSSYTGSPRNGTIGQPYNSWAEVPKGYGTVTQNKTYLFKRGTTNYGAIEFLNKENINIGAYGVGTRPKIIYTGDSYAINIRFYGNPNLQQNSNTRIVGLEVSATKNADALVRFSSNTSVENCYLHNAGWGLRSTGDPIGSGSSIKNIKLKNSVIEDIADDGMYIKYVNGIIIEDNLIRTVNQNYYLVGPSQQDASGDGIQIVGCANWQIINNRIDRSDTANKFNFITSYDVAVSPYTAVIEGNTFISPRPSSQGGAIFYASNHAGVGYQNMGSGYNVYMRNNIFSGAVLGTSLSSVWYHGENLYSSGNVYKNMLNCLTNRWFKAGFPQVPIYSQGDVFIGCTNNTIGNVIILPPSSPVTNNNPIISNQLFAIFKNDPNGTFVGDVVASDPDSGQAITYSIVGGNTNNAFSINTNGKIIVNNATTINNTSNAFYTLTVRVQDSGTPSLYAEAQIKVVIDSTPLIYPQIFAVNRYTSNGTIIGNVVADNPYNSSPLTYSIMGGNTNNIFAITSTGVLYVNNAALIASSSSSSHSISIKVDGDGSLSPNSAGARIKINVNNNSDNKNNDDIVGEGSGDIQIDNELPVTKVSKIYTSNKTKFTIRLLATDDKKIKKTYYKIGYLSWKTGKTFTTTYKKNMLVKFYSEDIDGNKEAVKTIQIIKKGSKFNFIEKR